MKSNPGPRDEPIKKIKKQSILDKIDMPSIIIEQEGQEESRKPSLLIKPDQVANFLNNLSKRESQMSEHPSDHFKMESPYLTHQLSSVIQRADKNYIRVLKKKFNFLRKLKENFNQVEVDLNYKEN